MSHILFGNTIDMLIIATPSTGYIVAYDLDNTLKQKDSNGVLSPIGGSQDLKTVLKYGNDSATYSITLGTYSEINSNAGGRILLSEGGTQSILLDVKSLSSTASINLKPSGISLFNNSLTNNNTLLFNDKSYSLSTATESNGHIISTTIENSYDSWSLKFRDNSSANEYLDVISAKNISDSIGTLKASLNLNSKNSTTQLGIENSVIIGGISLNATQSNTVYLGNYVNINNEYTLPSMDGTTDQILKTDGNGNLDWVSMNSFVVGLSDVLSVSASTGLNNIEIESGYSLKSSNVDSGSSILLDWNVENNILISNPNSSINLTPDGEINITTVDGRGVIYSGDYSQNFVPESLVSKRYVDDLITSLNIDIHYEGNIVYVDPHYGNDDTGQTFRRDLPFLTIGSASEAILANGGLVYIKAGEYNEMCVLTDGLKYYCEPGVIFQSGGFTDYTSVVNCDIYGHAKFIGDSILLKPFTVNNQSNINFEFDEIKMTNSYQAIVINDSSSVNIRGNSINSTGVRSVYIKGSGNNNINIKGDIIGKNNTVFFESFTGNCIINSNNIITNNSTYQASSLYGLNTNNGVTGKIVINSNIKNLGTYTPTAKTNSAIRISSGYFTINGDVDGGVDYSVIITGSSLGNVIINGNLYSSVESLYNDTTAINLKLNSSHIITSGLSATYSIVLNNSNNTETYLNGCNIVNLTNNSNLIWIGNSNSKFGSYNTNGFSIGLDGYFIDTNQSLNVGIHNTRSNKDNNLSVNDLFEPSGFIYDSNFYLPTF